MNRLLPLTIVVLLSTLPAALAATPPPPPERLPGWAIDKVADARLDAVHRCYLEHVPHEVRVGNGDNARVSYRFHPSGEVDSVVFVDTTVTQTSAKECILASLRQGKAVIASQKPTTATVWFGLSSKRSEMRSRVEDDPATRITSQTIVDGAKAKMSDFMGCYEARLEARPNLEGRITIAITVGAAGTVTSVKVIESIDPEVDACVVGQARSLVFAAPGDDAPVIGRIPITFKSK